MAIYHITNHHGETVTRKRKDSAADSYYRAVYEQIASWAGLDTAWGHATARRAIVACADIERGVLVGWTHATELRGETVTIRREA